MRLSGTKTGSANQYNGLGDQLYDKGGARPTLDLNFASNGSLVDSVTGKTLVTHTRASNATYVDGDGVIKDAALNYFKYSEDIGYSGWNVRSGTTRTANQEAPNGSNTATLITHSSGDGYVWRNDAGFTSGGDFVLSVYAKKVSGTPTLTPSMWLGTSAGASTDPAASVTDEWVRYDFNLTRQYLAGGQDYGFFVTGGSVLLWGAQLEQSSTLGEYVKTTSTINSAPRFDHKVTRTTTNLGDWSEDLNQFTAQSGSILTNHAIAPDGTLSADAFVENTITAQHQVRETNFPFKQGNQYTISFFAKRYKGARDFKVLTNSTNNAFFLAASVDLETGETEITNNSDIQATGSYDYGNGWWRFWLTTDAAASDDTVSVFFRLWKEVGNYEGDGESGNYLWGVQIEQATTVGPYVKTEASIATKVDAEPLGLLVEESRENLLLRSEEFDNASWIKIRSSVSANATAAPDGTTTAEKLVEDSTASATHQTSQTITKAASAIAYVTSIYVKASERSRVFVGLSDFGGNESYAIFNLSTKTAGTPVNSGTFTGGVASITELSNGWFRCSISATSSTATTIGILVRIVDSSNNFVYTGDGTSGIYLWGAQLEAGSFPTSYIRTTGSSVTRSADVTSIEGNDFGTFNQERYSEDVWQKSQINLSAQPNAITSPVNTFTGIKLTEDASGTGGPRFYENSYIKARDFVSGVTYTVSAYFKAGTQTYGSLAFRTSINYTCGAVFNLSNGTVTSENTYSGWTNTSSTIESVGNGWYRCTLTSTAGQTTTAGYTFYGITDGTAIGNAGYTSYTLSGKYIYVWGMQREESSTATPYVKSDVTWTSRASNATYYDYTGTLKKSSYNLLLGSEDMETGLWSKINLAAFGSGSIANDIAAPDGTITADKITANTSSGNHFVRQIDTFLANTTYTVSVYAKAAEQSILRVSCQVSGSGNARFYVNLSDQTITTDFSNWTILGSSVTSVGNSWYRCELAFTVSSTGGAGYIDIGGTTASGVDSYVGNNTDGIYLWGAQLETGPYAGDYVKTTSSAASSARNVAFLPDGSGNFVSAGELLLEDAGTNIHRNNSEDFRGSGTGNGDRLHWDATNTEVTAPDGQSTVFKAYFDGTETTPHGSVYVFGQNLGSNYQTTNTHTSSVWIKPVLETSFRFVAHTQYASATAGGTGENVDFFFDLTGNGSVTSIETGGIDASVEKHPNGWYRLSITYHRNSTVSASTYYGVILFMQNYASYNANSENGTLFYLWGPQVEESDYATSYIPTYGSTATRAADVSSSSSNTFGNSFYNQTEGTVFSVATTSTSNNSHILWGVSTGSFSSSIYPVKGTSNNLTAAPAAPPSDVSLIFGPIVSNQKFRLSTGFTSDTGGSFSGSKNGGAIQTDNSTGIPVTMNRLSIGTAPWSLGSSLWNGTISRLTVWPTRLSNDTLQTITE